MNYNFYDYDPVARRARHQQVLVQYKKRRATVKSISNKIGICSRAIEMTIKHSKDPVLLNKFMQETGRVAGHKYLWPRSK